MTPAEKTKLKALMAAAREEVAEEARVVREAYAAKRLEEYKERLRQDGVKLSSEDEERALKGYRRAVEEHKLPSYFELTLESGECVKVADLRRDPDRYHGQRCRDPLEPDYGNDPRIAYINLRSGGKPYIWSHAHGGQYFELLPDKIVVQFREGDGPLLFKEADAALARDGDVFEVAGKLSRVVAKTGGQVKPITAPWLALRLEERIRFERFNVSLGKWVPKDCPRDLPGKIIDSQGGWSVKRLAGIIKAPVLREDGSILSAPGWDAASGLLHLVEKPLERGFIPARPDKEHARAALRKALEPVALFPYRDALDRGVLLAAMFTSVQRQMLECAPAFGVDAPAPGSGKTKLGLALSGLGGGMPAVSPWSKNKEEQAKALLSHLLGMPQALLLDNIDAPVESAELNALLTSTTGYKARRLGVTEDVLVPSRVLVLLTGNNLTIRGDLSRRVFRITLDSGLERPDMQRFSFDPVALMREHWREYRMALLTVLRAYLGAGAPTFSPGDVGSYERWDRMIRQCVLWIAAEGLAPFDVSDPAGAIERNRDEDRDTTRLARFTHAWRGVFGDKPMSVKAATSYAQSGVAAVESFDGPVAEGAGDASERRQALLDVFEEIAGEGPRATINTRILGNWIAKFKNRIAGDLRIEAAKMDHKVQLWRVASAVISP